MFQDDKNEVEQVDSYLNQWNLISKAILYKVLQHFYLPYILSAKPFVCNQMHFSP